MSAILLSGRIADRRQPRRLLVTPTAAAMSEVQPSYVSAGSALIAAAVPGPEALSPGISERVHQQLARWLGASTRQLTNLRTGVIRPGSRLSRRL